MNPNDAALLGCILLIVLLAGSMPVAFVMAAVGLAGFALVVSPQAALSLLATDLFETVSSYSLTVIPLFIFMGQIAFHAGISRRLFRTAYCWLGRLPGGLAMATIAACTAFGAICGSGPATAATMASVALPEMRRYRYSMELGCGSVAAGGSLGMLIPPSVVFIVYAVMTEQSVGELFLAGIVPGLLIGAAFCVTIYVQCRLRPGLGPAGPGTTMRDKIRSLGGVWETLLLFLTVIGGMFLGFFTPTEAASIGAAGSLILALLKRSLSWRGFVQAVRETARTSCMVMIVIFGAVVFGHFLAITRIPFTVAGWLTSLAVAPWVVMALIIAFYLLSGCFVDALALILLTIPILYPVIVKLGYDPVWFGVIAVVVTQMGVISPPVGVNAYVVSGIERDVPLQTVFKGALPFLAALVLAAALLVAFPALSLFLPRLIRS